MDEKETRGTPPADTEATLVPTQSPGATVNVVPFPAGWRKPAVRRENVPVELDEFDPGPGAA